MKVVHAWLVMTFLPQPHNDHVISYTSISFLTHSTLLVRPLSTFARHAGSWKVDHPGNDAKFLEEAHQTSLLLLLES